MRDLGRGDRGELRRHLRLRMGSPPRLRRLLPLVITPSSTRPQPNGLRERLDHRHTEHGAGGACWWLPDARGGHRIASLAEARSEELLVPSFVSAYSTALRSECRVQYWSRVLCTVRP